MIRICSIIALFFCLLPPPVSAAETMGDWRYSMPIQTGGSSKYKCVTLTEEVYENASPTLSDLRVIDARGNRVPFYIKTGLATLRQNQIRYTASVVQKSKKKNDCTIDFMINERKANEDISGNSLIFELPEGNFLKHLKVYGGNDGERWDYIGKDYVFREESRQKNEVALGKHRKYTYYRIVILDNPEDIALDRMELVNQYTNHQRHDYTKTAPIDFAVETVRNESIVTLANPQKLRIKQVKFSIEDNFQREYQVYGESASKTVLKKGELYNLQLENVKIAEKVIEFGYHPISSAALILKINNRDDRPLVINSISIEYYLDKLIFPDDGNAPYQLYFGNSSAAKPSYEIALQQKYIDREAQDDCALGAMQTKQEAAAPAPGSMNTKYVFNGVIIAVSILLIGFLITKLGKSG